MARAMAACIAAMILAGCVAGPEYERPELALPDAWPEQPVLDIESGESLAEWWRRFEAPALNTLVERALADNIELQIQAARVEEARARLGLARAEQFPTVSAQAEATRQRQPAAVFGIEGIESEPRNLFQVAGVLDYEIDLWGRLAREREAAGAELQRNAYAREAMRLAVITDVVVGYFGLRSAQRQLEITSRTIEVREESVRVERLRYEAGQIDELAFRQAQAELAGTRAELPLRIEELQRLESALSILLGIEPAELFRVLEIPEVQLEQAVLPASVPADLPSELLNRRPDLRAVEAELMAATANVGVAEAGRLPRLNLAALAGTAAAETSLLFQGEAETWSAGASLAGPVFDFGRGRARVETSEALREQAELRYRATVARALVEVRDALVFYRSSGDRFEATKVQVDALRRTEELARIRYDAGYIGILELLIVQRALLNAELGHASARSARFAATATLFKALGGGWEEVP